MTGLLGCGRRGTGSGRLFRSGEWHIGAGDIGDRPQLGCIGSREWWGPSLAAGLRIRCAGTSLTRPAGEVVGNVGRVVRGVWDELVV